MNLVVIDKLLQWNKLSLSDTIHPCNSTIIWSREHPCNNYYWSLSFSGQAKEILNHLLRHEPWSVCFSQGPSKRRKNLLSLTPNLVPFYLTFPYKDTWQRKCPVLSLQVHFSILSSLFLLKKWANSDFTTRTKT